MPVCPLPTPGEDTLLALMDLSGTLSSWESDFGSETDSMDMRREHSNATAVGLAWPGIMVQDGKFSDVLEDVERAKAAEADHIVAPEGLVVRSACMLLSHTEGKGVPLLVVSDLSHRSGPFKRLVEKMQERNIEEYEDWTPSCSFPYLFYDRSASLLSGDFSLEEDPDAEQGSGGRRMKLGNQTTRLRFLDGAKAIPLPLLPPGKTGDSPPYIFCQHRVSAAR